MPGQDVRREALRLVARQPPSSGDGAPGGRPAPDSRGKAEEEQLWFSHSRTSSLTLRFPGRFRNSEKEWLPGTAAPSP